MGKLQFPASIGFPDTNTPVWGRSCAFTLSALCPRIQLLVTENWPPTPMAVGLRHWRPLNTYAGGAPHRLGAKPISNTLGGHAVQYHSGYATATRGPATLMDDVHRKILKEHTVEASRWPTLARLAIRRPSFDSLRGRVDMHLAMRVFRTQVGGDRRWRQRCVSAWPEAWSHKKMTIWRDSTQRRPH